MLGMGQLLFKLAAEDMKLKIPHSWVQALLSPWLLGALLLYAFSTVLWIWILSQEQLSRVYPFALLGAAFVPIVAHFVLGEHLSIPFFIGMFFVLLGIVIIQFS